MARQMGLPVAEKADSQEICFVPNGDYAAFIEAWFREQGAVRRPRAATSSSTSGQKLGEHSGVHHFTSASAAASRPSPWASRST